MKDKDAASVFGANGRRGVPERMLWAEVLALAIRDLITSRGVNRDNAVHFIYKRKRWFSDVCDLAGLDPDYVMRIINQAQNDPDKVRLVNEFAKNSAKSRRVISDAFRAKSGRRKARQVY